MARLATKSMLEELEFSFGGDFDPYLEGEEDTLKVGNTDEARDAFDPGSFTMDSLGLDKPNKASTVIEEDEGFSDDFSFYEGYDTLNDQKIDAQDLTTPVTNYTTTGMSFPCVIFKDNFQCPKHKLTVLSNMVNSGSKALKDISLYFRMSSGLFELGKLSSFQMNAMLDLIGYENLDGYYDKDIPLKGDKLYVLCSSSV